MAYIWGVLKWPPDITAVVRVARCEIPCLKTNNLRLTIILFQSKRYGATQDLFVIASRILIERFSRRMPHINLTIEDVNRRVNLCSLDFPLRGWWHPVSRGECFSMMYLMLQITHILQSVWSNATHSRHQFNIGISTVTISFSDDANNSISCQWVTVVKGSPILCLNQKEWNLFISSWLKQAHHEIQLNNPATSISVQSPPSPCFLLASTQYWVQYKVITTWWHVEFILVFYKLTSMTPRAWAVLIYYYFFINIISIISIIIIIFIIIIIIIGLMLRWWMMSLPWLVTALQR